MGPIRIARITTEPLSITEHLDAVADPAAGAVASFIGTVRDHDADATAPVVALDYSAHPDAHTTLQGIIATAIDQTQAIVAASHRVGRVEVGEPAVVIAVATAHRAEAFEVCREIIEAIKRDLPVWKRQLASDGSADWKGIGG